MAEHKVPQDVEAEDKLLGPFSFRQFIYLMIAVGAGVLAFFLGRLAIPLAFIPLPILVLFGILALPLRKDQPMETYVAAMIKFFLTPHVRLWDPDGRDTLVEISNPIVDDEPKTKEVGGDEAARRLSFLADVEDTQGWATRGVGAPPVNTTSLNDDLVIAADNAQDILDNSASLSQSFDDLLSRSGNQVKQAAVARMQSDAGMLASVTPTAASATTAQTAAASPTSPVSNTAIASSPFMSVDAAMMPPAPPPQDDAAAERAAEELLKQAALPTAAQPNYQEKVIQPPSATAPAQPAAPAMPTNLPVVEAAPPVTAQPPAAPIQPTMAAAPAPAAAPTTSSAPTAPAAAVPPTTPPPEPVTSPPKSDIINSEPAGSVDETETINHNEATLTSADDGAVEIKLH